MERPDLSNYLAHFTKSGWPCGHHDPDNPTNSIKYKNAQDRLLGILENKKIFASQLPWVGKHNAVCLTECPWTGMLGHTQRYSPYGIGFTKEFVFSKGGGPVYYVRADKFNEQQWAADILPFVTPFWPSYAPKESKKMHLDGKTVDYTHEREWRTTEDLSFEYTDISFVILPDYKAMAAFPQIYKDAIGREKFLLMDNYKMIEQLWPVHVQK